MTTVEPQPGEVEPSGMTPEDAKDAMDELIGQRLDVAHDHPTYKRLTRQIERLAGVLSQDQADRQEEQHFEAVAEVEEHQSAPELERKREAEKEVEILKSLGFEGEVPDVVQPHQLTALKMQRLNAENKVDELAPLMLDELRSLRAPENVLEAFRTYVRVPDLDPDLRERIFGNVIEYVYKANEARYGKAPK